MNLLTQHPIVASLTVVALVKLLSLLTNSPGQTWARVLPWWCDISQWSRWGLAGTIGQLAVTAAGAGGAVLVAAIQTGVPPEAWPWEAAGHAVLGALGIVTGVKQLSPARAARKRDEHSAVTGTLTTHLCGYDDCGNDVTHTSTLHVEVPANSAYPTTVGTKVKLWGVTLLMLAGCQQVQDASDYVARVCDGYLAAQPEVQVEAKRRGVSPLEVATAICLLNDAGRFIWELFEPAGADGKRLAVSAGGLESAKSRALAVAREKGTLQ